MRKSIGVWLLAPIAVVPPLSALVAFSVLLCLPIVAQSGVIVVGNHPLLPNTPNQQVEIFISGGDLIDAVELYATVGNVPKPSQTLSPAADQSPTITVADVIGAAGFPATILTGNANAPINPLPATATTRTVAYADGTADLGFSATDNGVFGTLVFDTTGIFAGPVQKTWALRLGGPGHNTVALSLSSSDIGLDAIGNTLFPTITDGTVFIPAPEPSSIVLALFAAGLAAVAIRRLRARHLA